MFLDERVRAELAASTRFGDIRLLDVTDSTNRVVADMAAAGVRGGAAQGVPEGLPEGLPEGVPEDVPEGVVVVADLQTAGRGRLDRTWEAEPGDALLVSVLLRPEGLPLSRWHLVTAAAGLAACDACAEVAGLRPDLKWPNDLIDGGNKLAGILAESTSGALVLGMGLNVHSGPPGSAWLDDLAGRRVPRADLLVAWLKTFDRLMGEWDLVASRYRRECTTVGKEVAVEQVGSRIVGTAVDIDDDGRLIVRPAEPGPDVAVSAGDVIHLRPA